MNKTNDLVSLFGSNDEKSYTWDILGIQLPNLWTEYVTGKLEHVTTSIAKSRCPYQVRQIQTAQYYGNINESQ